MYKLEYLPAARRDMVSIVRYIARELGNVSAAERLALELTSAADNLSKFPYASPVHIPIRPLEYEYRKVSVRNYLLFYRVDEARKLVTVARVVYAGRDYERLL